MLLPEHKFIIEKISNELETKSKNKYRELILKKNAPTDDFGDQIGKDDLFKITVWEKYFDKIQGLKVSDKVLAQLYMNGREDIDQNSRVYYSITFTIRQIKLYTPETR